MLNKTLAELKEMYPQMITEELIAKIEERIKAILKETGNHYATMIDHRMLTPQEAKQQIVEQITNILTTMSKKFPESLEKAVSKGIWNGREDIEIHLAIPMLAQIVGSALHLQEMIMDSYYIPITTFEEENGEIYEMEEEISIEELTTLDISKEETYQAYMKADSLIEDSLLPEAMENWDESDWEDEEED